MTSLHAAVVFSLALLATSPTSGAADPAGPHLVPLVGTEPGESAAAPDLDALARWLGSARVVGLGESVHGVRTFHRLAHRIFAHLAERHGFTVFALEISQAHAARLDRFVTGERDDLDALIAERWWPAQVFYDRALRDLLVWMRHHNETARRPLRFAGFDFKQPSFAMDAVTEGLRGLDAEAASRAEALFAIVRALDGFGVYPNVYGYSGSLEIPLPPRAESLPLRVRFQSRASGMTHGWAGLTLEGSDSSGSREHLGSRYLKPNELSAQWRDTSLERTLDSSTEALHLMFFHRGNGTVWLDGVEVWLGGRKLELETGLGALRPRPLDMPHVQAMDHSADLDEQVSVDGGSSLRITCDPAVDEALKAAREADTLVRELTVAGRSEASAHAWLRQMSRLVVQATEYRTLVETNRDVFMAENAAWLARRGFPDERTLVLAHSSHTNRDARGRSGMGSFLADELGAEYRTVTMLALAGQYRYFGPPRDLTPASGLELHSFGPGGNPLAKRLASFGEGDLIVHLESGRKALWAGSRLDWTALPAGELADVAILVRQVVASGPPSP